MKKSQVKKQELQTPQAKFQTPLGKIRKGCQLPGGNSSVRPSRFKISKSVETIQVQDLGMDARPNALSSISMHPDANTVIFSQAKPQVNILPVDYSPLH